MKALFYGAGAAAIAGLLMGGALKAQIAPTSIYGQQLLISQPRERTPSAVDLWVPTEGAPPSYVAEASWSPPGSEDAEQPIGEPANLGAGPTPERVEPIRLAHPDSLPEPEPYLPSRRGDILAPAPYEIAAVDLPRHDWSRRGGSNRAWDHGPAPAYDDERYAPRYDHHGPDDGVYGYEPMPYDGGYR